MKTVLYDEATGTYIATWLTYTCLASSRRAALDGLIAMWQRRSINY